MEDTQTADVPAVSDSVVHYYSPTSEIRNPVQLIGNILRDTHRGRELSWRLFVRNLRGLYRQTLLGFFWAFLPPIVNTAFWLFLREAEVFDTGKMPVNSTVFILTGMIFWQAFIESFQAPLDTLNKNRNMVSKLNFPRESLLMVGFGEVIFNFLIRLTLLIPTFLIFQFSPPSTIFMMPVVALALISLGFGLGLLLLPIGSLYQDVSRFIAMALPFWMILTPVVYMPLGGAGSILNWLNPVSPLLIVARDWTLVGATDFGLAALIYGAGAVLLLLLGLIIFRVSIPILVERMAA